MSREKIARYNYEKWLFHTHGLKAEWEPERNCYKEFACHLAWKVWQAALLPESAIKLPEKRKDWLEGRISDQDYIDFLESIVSPQGRTGEAVTLPIKFVPKSNLPVQRAEAPHEPEQGISRDLIKEIGAQIGRDIAAYVEVMYPEAIKATSSTFKLSLRNSIHNAIVSIADLHDEASIRKRLADNEAFRKEWLAQWRKIRRKKPQATRTLDEQT